MKVQWSGGTKMRGRGATWRCLVYVCCMALNVAGLATLAPGWASAATLPDGRGYEQVSPAEKNGSAAGVGFLGEPPGYAIAGADGKSLLYSGLGPIGDANAGVDFYSIARREASGWSNSPALPRAIGRQSTFPDLPIFLAPSADLSQLAFTAGASYVPGDIATEFESSSNVFQAEAGGALSWLGRPEIENPIPGLGENPKLSNTLGIAGVSSSPNVTYFTYFGTLVPEDASRAPHVEPTEATDPWGFYMWKDGRLSAAGVLPKGELDPFGAVPAATQSEHPTPDDFDNQVSEDGSKAFFVSPDPTVTHPGDPSELYVRENGDKTVLVSRQEGAGEVPAADGPSVFKNPDICGGDSCATYVYASPDGSQAFFESVDKLAKSASGEEPSGEGPWEYDFDTLTETLTYLPGVTDGAGGSAPLVASSKDGSRFLFERVDSANQAVDLELWSNGQITTVSSLPAAVNTETNNACLNSLCIAPARATADGSVFVFETDSPLPGANPGEFNNGGGFEQVYRYETATRELSCVSCPPAGVTPSGDANLSNNDRGQSAFFIVGSRGISEDGGEVFFDTPDPLVSQDINDKRDVYEWEGDHDHLISSGTDPHDSFFMDNSPSGSDVFFTTAAALVPADTDGGYDVYDAHVGGGTTEAPPPVGCSSACQGPSSPAPIFGTPASATFSGEGNLPAVKSPAAKPKAKAKKPKKSKKHTPAKKKGKAKSKGKARKSAVKRAGTSGRGHR